MIIYNIKEMIATGNEEIVRKVISSFSCAKTNEDGTAEILNSDIESFLYTNAIQFAKMSACGALLIIMAPRTRCHYLFIFLLLYVPPKKLHYELIFFQ